MGLEPKTSYSRNGPGFLGNRFLGIFYVCYLPRPGTTGNPVFFCGTCEFENGQLATSQFAGAPQRGSFSQGFGTVQWLPVSDPWDDGIFVYIIIYIYIFFLKIFF